MKRALYIIIGLIAFIALPIAGEAIAPVAPAPELLEVPDTATPQPKRTPMPSPELIDEPKQPETTPEMTFLGKFIVTAYCPCSVCCGKWSNPDNPITASGDPAVEGITVGADWDMLPAGTEIYIEGVGWRTVKDKPAGWIIKRYDGRILDLYFENHADAWNFGKQELEIWIKKEAA